jgi:uncharacterized protein YggE
MKKIFFLLLCCCFLFSSHAKAQEIKANPFPKRITVTGSAEMSVVPDQIFVNITLREYQKKGDPKVELDGIRTKFLESCKAAGIPDSCIHIESYSGSGNYYQLIRSRKKQPDLFSAITYQVQFSTSQKMTDLADRLDDDATTGFLIIRTSHSNITEYRKQLKIEAVTAAKAKAIYLTNAINEKLGEAIDVKEPTDPGEATIKYSNTYAVANSNIVMESYEKDKVSTVAFNNIKLRFEVEIIFALK